MSLIRKPLILILSILVSLALLPGCGATQGAGPAGGEVTHGDGHTQQTAGESPAHEPADEETTPSPSPSPAPPSPPPTAEPTASPVPTPTPKGLVADGWISGIPEYVPRFGYGTLDMEKSKITEASISTLFELKFRGVTRDDLDSYADALRKQGYRVAVDLIGNTHTLTASLDLGWNCVSLVITLEGDAGVASYVLDAPV